MAQSTSAPILQITISLTIMNGQDALNAHMVAWDNDKAAQKQIEDFIWAGTDVAAILECNERVGFPDDKLEMICKTIAEKATPANILATLEWIDHEGPA